MTTYRWVIRNCYSLHFSAYLNIFIINISSFFKSALARRMEGMVLLTEKMPSVMSKSLALRPGGAHHSGRWSSPLFTSLGHTESGQEVILVFLLPPQAVLAPVGWAREASCPSQGKVPSDRPSSAAHASTGDREGCLPQPTGVGDL